MGVNYLIEINALDDWELTHPLSATAYKVMRKLLYLANKERFPEKMSVSNTVLMSLVGCSEDSLIKARNQLIQAGLIAYKGQKKVTPLYMICYFSLNPVYNTKLQGYEQGNMQGIKQGYIPGITPGNEQGTYINQNNGEGEGESAILYFERRGIVLGDSQYEAIRDFYECGITDDMLRFAADEAVEYNAVSFAYIRRVVDNWICGGVRTLEEAKAWKAKFRQEQSAAKAVRQQRPTPQQPSQPGPPAPKFFADRWNKT